MSDNDNDDLGAEICARYIPLTDLANPEDRAAIEKHWADTSQDGPHRALFQMTYSRYAWADDQDGKERLAMEEVEEPDGDPGEPAGKVVWRTVIGVNEKMIDYLEREGMIWYGSAPDGSGPLDHVIRLAEPSDRSTLERFRERMWDGDPGFGCTRFVYDDEKHVALERYNSSTMEVLEKVLFGRNGDLDKFLRGKKLIRKWE